MKATWRDRWRNWSSLRKWQARAVLCRLFGHSEQGFTTRYGEAGSVVEHGCARCGAFPL